jgi:hypothetical protein
MGKHNLADESVKDYWQRIYPKPYSFETPEVVKKLTDLTGQCPTYWGTHGCDKQKGHKNARHICRDSDTGKVCGKVTEITDVGDHKGFLMINPAMRYAVDKAGYLWELYA